MQGVGLTQELQVDLVDTSVCADPQPAGSFHRWMNRRWPDDLPHEIPVAPLTAERSTILASG